MTKRPNRRAAIYVRTNQDPRSVAELRRLNAQIELCVTTAKTNGFHEDELIVYKDEGTSGVAKSAPDRTRLLNDVSCYSMIFVPDVDRISRDGDQCARIVQSILNAGAEIWCCQSMRPFQSSNDNNEMIMRLREFAREIDREQHSKEGLNKCRFSEISNATMRVCRWVTGLIQCFPKVAKNAYAKRVQMKRSAHSTTADVNSQSTIGEANAIQKK